MSLITLLSTALHLKSSDVCSEDEVARVQVTTTQRLALRQISGLARRETYWAMPLIEAPTLCGHELSLAVGVILPLPQQFHVRPQLKR